MVKTFHNFNRLPVPTWSWLKINSTSFEVEEQGGRGYEKEVRLILPPGVKAQKGFYPIETKEVLEQMPENYEFAAQHHNNAWQITIPEGLVADEPIIVDYTLDENNNYLVDYIHIKAEKDSNVTVMIRYAGQGEEELFHFGLTLIEAEESAKVKLIKAQFLPENALHVDGVLASCKKAAVVDVLLGEMGSQKSISSCHVSLLEAQSSGRIDGIYLGKNQKDMDMNYRIAFAGQETEGHILVKGALGGSARKTLKSTIDFISGASGAQGSEEETVLALSDKVVNRSAPLLLCGEEDVMGSHATSTGRPDPRKLFYLLNRGFTEKEARRLLVEASFAPILGKVESDEIKQEMIQYIGAIVYEE